MASPWNRHCGIVSAHFRSLCSFRKRVKADVIIFHQNVRRLSLFRKNIFPFSYVAPFGYDKSANEGTIKFLAKFGAISSSPWK